MEISLIKNLNDPNSEIYKKTLKKQIKFIEKRLLDIKSKYLNDKMGCCGSKNDIVEHFNNGPSANTVLQFFNFPTDKCIICGGKKGENNIKQLERAHCYNYSRRDLLKMVINDLWIDEKEPIIAGEILKKFIEYHKICPIYIQCKKCHNNYDKVSKKLKEENKKNESEFKSSTFIVTGNTYNIYNIGEAHIKQHINNI